MLAVPHVSHEEFRLDRELRHVREQLRVYAARLELIEREFAQLHVMCGRVLMDFANPQITIKVDEARMAEALRMVDLDTDVGSRTLLIDRDTDNTEDESR